MLGAITISMTLRIEILSQVASDFLKKKKKIILKVVICGKYKNLNKITKI